MGTSLYIHIPFCKSKCSYCSFYSIPYKDNLASAYIDVISKQIESIDTNISSIYIGGGTPTAMKAQYLEKILKSLKKYCLQDVEASIEANPDSLNTEKLSILLNGGVNRISIGIQSFNDAVLQKLGRIHNVREAEDAVYRAEKTGFKNISIDLMFGVWGQTMEEWQKDLEYAVKLPVMHISCYAMTYEKNTPLSAMISRGDVIPIDEGLEAKMYEQAIYFLPEHGFKQYEVSNFSKEGYACRHNINYWENNPYIGIGASAVSYINGVREANVSDVEEYINRAGHGEVLSPYKEQLIPIRNAKETAALKIRTNEGIDFAWFKKKTGFDFLEIEKDALPELIENKFLAYNNIKNDNKNTGVFLTKKGFLFCDTVSSSFL